MGLFLGFGASMAALAGATLMWPGTFVDRFWALNPAAYQLLAPLGRSAGVAFFLLSTVLALSALGWFRRRRWGWQLAVGIITAQILGGLGNAVRGELLKGAFGALAAGALLYYLTRPSVRAAFRSGEA